MVQHRPLHAYMLGWRARRSNSGLQSAALAAATALLALSLASIIWLVGTYTGMAERDAQRALRDAAAHPDEAVVALVDVRTVPDDAGYARIAVMLPASTSGFTGTPPPGLPRWPALGEVWMSERMADGRVIGSSTELGRLAGFIGTDGLVIPNERVAYASPADATVTSRYWEITGFGEASGGGRYIGAPATTRPLSQPLAAMIFFLFVPALLSGVLAARTTSPAFVRRAALLDALGASGMQRCLYSAGQATLPVAIGGGIAASLLCASALPESLPLWGSDFALDGDDLRHGLLLSLLMVPLAGAAVLGLASWVDPPKPEGANFTRLEAPRRRWIIGLAAVTMVAHYQAPTWQLGAVPLLIIVVLTAGVGIVAMTQIVSVLVALTGSWVASARRPRGSSLVAARMAAASRRLSMRASTGLVAGIVIAGSAQLYLSQLAEAAAQAQALQSVVGGSILVADVAEATSEATAATVSAAGSDVAVLGIYDVEGGASHVITSCTWVIRLVPDCGSPADVDRVLRDDYRLAAVTPWVTASADAPTVEVTPSVPVSDLDRLLLVAPAGSSIDVAELTSAGFQNGVTISEPGSSWILGTALSRYQFRWLVWWGAIGIAMLTLGGVLAAAGDGMQQARRAAPVVMLVGRRRAVWVLAAWQVLLPVVFGILLGSLFYLVYSVPLVQFLHSQVSWGLLFAVTVGGSAIGLVVWVATSCTLARFVARSRDDLSL